VNSTNFRRASSTFAQNEHCSTLRHGFDYKDARHDGRARKVTLKVGLVDADLLDAYDAFAPHQLSNSIYEEKGIAMRREVS
jgi:hypothetical protein